MDTLDVRIAKVESEGRARFLNGESAKSVEKWVTDQVGLLRDEAEPEQPTPSTLSTEERMHAMKVEKYRREFREEREEAERKLLHRGRKMRGEA